MKILVTGGFGFLGKRLVKKLLCEKHDVIIFSHNENNEVPDGVTFVEGDIRDKEKLREAFDGADIVYHLAACLDEADKEMWEINLKGTQNVVELCKENRIKQLIYISSIGVLGETEEPAKEDFPYNPKTKYEKSKAEGEKLIKNSGVPYTIIRTTIVLGPNLIWMKIFEAARKGYPIIGNGRNYLHLVYVDDVVDMLCFVKGNRKAINQIFHLASKDVHTYEEVYNMICQELKCEKTNKHIHPTKAYIISHFHTIKRRFQGKQPSLTAMKSSIDRLIRNRIVSIEKAKKVLGFEPKYSTREAIHETIKYIRISRLGYSDYDLAEIHSIKKK